MGEASEWVIAPAHRNAPQCLDKCLGKKALRQESAMLDHGLIQSAAFALRSQPPQRSLPLPNQVHSGGSLGDIRLGDRGVQETA